MKRIAALFGSQVTLVHVVDLESHNGFELYLRPLHEIAEEHRTIARRKLALFLESEFPPATCSRVLRSGEAAVQIAEVARAGKFNLIIMPTHPGRFRQMLFGSTTAKVLNDSRCPVMTVEHAEMTMPRPLEHREWLCAIGLSADSERVLRLASRAATQVGAKLSVIHAIHGTRSASLQLGDEAQLDSAEKRNARRHSKLLARDGAAYLKNFLGTKEKGAFLAVYIPGFIMYYAYKETWSQARKGAATYFNCSHEHMRRSHDFVSRDRPSSWRPSNRTDRCNLLS